MLDPVHDLRAGRGRPPGRRQARRHAPGVRPRQARVGPGQGADPPPGPRRRRGARRRRDRGRAAQRRASPRCPRRGSARWRWTSSAALDHIAYIRFASVYQSFEDLEDLKREVDQLFAEGSPKKGKRTRMSVLADRDIRTELEAGRVRIDPYDPADLQPSSVDLHLDRVVPRVPQQPLRVHRPADAAARPDGAADGRGRRAVHPPPGRVRARADARVGRAAGRPRGAAGGPVARSGGWACSSTRRPATSTRAGRGRSRSSCRTSPTCRSRCTTGCGSGRSASSG